MKKLSLEQSKVETAKKIYEIFSQTKKDKTREIYNSIRENVNAYYSMLHPSDPHKNIAIDVVESRRASAHLKIESFGSAEDPRAFTSEGHLDSLGLCIFLAFVEKFNRDCPLVILDDVVTTIDAQHRDLICKLLFEKFKDRQLVITTHDAIWYDQICAAQKAYSIDGKCMNLDIVKWTFELGPQIEPYKPRWESIVSRIDSGDKQGAASESRVYLEWLLKRICLNMQAKVVFKTAGYTVADLLNPAKSRLIDLISNTEFKQMVIDSFREIESIGLMGNLLTHDNVDAANVSMDEVERFCLAIHAIRMILQCPECETFLRYYQDMRRTRCPNGRCIHQTEVVCS